MISQVGRVSEATAVQTDAGKGRGLQAAVKRHRAEIVILVLFVVAVVILFAPILADRVHRQTDYGAHIGFAQTLLDTGDFSHFVSTIPHFLYHALVIGGHFVVPTASLTVVGFAVALGLYVILGLVIYGFLRLILGKPHTTVFCLLYVGLTLILMLVGPIIILTPEVPYLVGYLSPHVYHNPTMVTLKPLTLVLFVLALQTVDRQVPKHRNRRLVLSALFTVLCILAKPSFVVILLPALAIVTLFRFVQHQSVHWVLLIGGIVLPACVLLGVQAILFDASRIILNPLAFYASRNLLDNLGLKLVLSILFPALVYLLYAPWARKTLYLNLGWLIFIFGAASTYLLAEENKVRFGNLTWSGQIGIFVLMTVSVVFWMSEFLPRRQQSARGIAGYLRIAVCGFVLALHVTGGIIWYLMNAGLLKLQ